MTPSWSVSLFDFCASLLHIAPTPPVHRNRKGGIPYLGYPGKLAKENVRGVVNLCDEYRGPLGAYKRLGIEQLYLPTVDHFEPDVESLKSAVSFIQEHEAQGNKGKLIEGQTFRAPHGVSSDGRRSLCALQGWTRPVCGGSFGLASL